MIYVNIPYCPKEHGKNLGYAYNKFMERLEDDDWACFLDHDAMFTTENWYHQLESIIKKHPAFGLFAAKTNRIGGDAPQKAKVDRDNHDIKYHRRIGQEIQNCHYDSIALLNEKSRLISGVVILIKKSTWKKVGGFKDGFFGIDNDIHSRCLAHGYKVGVMKGVYVYHWYRGEISYSEIRKRQKRIRHK